MRLLAISLLQLAALAIGQSRAQAQGAAAGVDVIAVSSSTALSLPALQAPAKGGAAQRGEAGAFQGASVSPDPSGAAPLRARSTFDLNSLNTSTRTAPMPPPAALPLSSSPNSLLVLPRKTVPGQELPAAADKKKRAGPRE
jgi:hypothetical protein